MKRVLSLVLALVLVLGMIPTFAADMTAGQHLYEHEFIAGVGNGELNEAGLLTREQLAKLILELNGSKEEAEVLTLPPSYTDSAKISAWARPYVAYAQIEGLMVGFTDGSFRPQAGVSGQQLAQVLTRALGYEFSWATVVAEAADLGIEVATGAALTRGEAFEAMWVTVNTMPKGETKLTLGQKLGKLDPPAPVLALALESVTSTNNLEIVLTFNNEVDKTTAETEANYTLSAGTVSEAVKDGKTVTLTLAAAAAQQASVDVTVKNVKDINGSVVANTTKTLKFFDSTVPAVKSVSVIGPKTLKVTFSEPITSTVITTTSNFVVDNNTYSIATVAASGNNAVVVTLGTTLPAGTHSITVNNAGTNVDPAIKDNAGFFVPKTTTEFAYVVDNVAPTATISSASQNKVKIVFDKEIDAATQANLVVYHTYSGDANYDAASYSWASDNKTVTATFATYLPVGNATIYVNNVSSTLKIKDLWSNAFVNASFTANITSDSTAPTVTLVEAKTSTTIEVTYSESVTGATTASNYTLKDSSGTAVTVSSVALKADNTYTLTTATLNGGSYTLTIKGIEDTSVSTNDMADYTTTIAVTDLVKPSVTTAGVYSTDKKKIVVKFDEAMAVSGTGSIVDEANYQVSLDGGTTWTDLADMSGATVAAGSGNKSVIITYTSAQATLTNGDIVKVGRVADVAGNLTAAFTTDVTLTVDDVVLANVTDTEKATSTTTVTFDVNTQLSGIDVNKFSLDTGAKAATSATYVNGDNKATITVTVATGDKFATDLSNLTNVQILAGGLTTVLGTTNSATVTIPVANILDYVAPSVVSTVTGDNDTDGHLDRIVVTYSEAIYVASVADADYTVEGYEVTGVTVAGAVVTINVKELASFDTGSTPKVTLVGAISDNTAQRNSLGAQSAVTSTDGAAPVLVSAIITTPGATAGFGNDVADKITLTFSEAVNTNFGVATAPTAAEIDAIYVFSTGALAGGTLTMTANDLSTTASNTLVLTTNVAGPTNVVTTAATVDAAVAPTANDIEDAANLTVVNAAAQATVNVD